MIPKRKRHWLGFSLRTMFAAWTVAAVWFGWNVHLVRQRAAIRAAVTSGPIAILKLTPDASSHIYESSTVGRFLNDTFGNRTFTQYLPTTPCRISRLRQWLGDEACYLIAYHPGPDPDRMQNCSPRQLWPPPSGGIAGPQMRFVPIKVDPMIR